MRLFPAEGAEIQRNSPERKMLEDAGLETYEFSADGLNLRWRVRKDDMLYLGETGIEGLDRPREVFEGEFHVSSRQLVEHWGETRERLFELPRLVSL